MDHKEQYQSYLAQAMSALEHACAHFLPEESEVCRAARYSLMGGGKRIRAVLVLAVCDMLHGNAEDLPAIKLLTRRPLCWPAMFF